MNPVIDLCATPESKAVLAAFEALDDADKEYVRRYVKDWPRRQGWFGEPQRWEIP